MTTSQNESSVTTGNGIIHKPYLILHVRKEYFDQIKAGKKDLEYRLFNDYWSTRLSGPAGSRGITYDLVLIACGYPKRKDPGRWLAFNYAGYHYPIEIQHEEFGPDPVKVCGIILRDKAELPPGWI